MFASGSALDVVPPIAGEKLLTEDGAVGTKERVLPAADVANVKHLSNENDQIISSPISSVNPISRINRSE